MKCVSEDYEQLMFISNPFNVKDTGLSVPLLTSVIRTPLTKSIVSFTIP